tara:strand:- start:125 stop:511 length:387 start_codon:yes stop_codon:yes gene_type:complete
MSELKKMPNKKKVISFLRSKRSINTDYTNINVSTINKSGIYSVEPKLNCVETDWNLLLIHTKNKVINHFIIPSNHSIYKVLYIREDKGRYRLLFEINDKAYIEQNCWKRFDQFLVGTYEYNDQEIFNV